MWTSTASLVQRLLIDTEHWELAFELCRDPVTQKRLRRTISFKGNKKEAEQALTAAMAQRDRVIDLAPDKATVGEYLTRWLRDYARPNVAPSTYERYAGIVAKHFNPAFGSLALSKLRSAHLQSAYALWIEKGLSAKTVVHHHRLIHEALGHAVDWQLLALNPATAAKPPRPAKAPITFFEPDEYARLRTTAQGKEPHATLIEMGIATGMRQGELLALRWQDTDLVNGTITVNPHCQAVHGQGHRLRRP